ncbi:MAG: hypothetical protein R3F40_01220 [Candidatus Competibacteraceae bacterium]
MRKIAIRWSSVPVPGPVIGMLLLFLTLRRKSLPAPLRAT